jgi:hypothetical protein
LLLKSNKEKTKKHAKRREFTRSSDDRTIEGMRNKQGPRRKAITREDYLEVRIEAREKQAFKDAADLAGLPVSGWVRDRLRRNARQELREAGQGVAFLE